MLAGLASWIRTNLAGAEAQQQQQQQLSKADRVKDTKDSEAARQ
jgi:hypothetical protein